MVLCSYVVVLKECNSADFVVTTVCYPQIFLHQDTFHRMYPYTSKPQNKFAKSFPSCLMLILKITTKHAIRHCVLYT